MLRIVALSSLGSCLGIAVCCVGMIELANLDTIGAIKAYLAGGSIGGACAAAINGLVEW